MSQDFLYNILSDQKDLASLPQVLMEVLRVSADTGSSASDLASVIMKDPMLTAKLLRVVNSPHYGPITKITTINQAVVALGLRSVTAIALTSSIYDKLNKVESAIDKKRFWRHSLEVGIAAKMIAAKINYQPAEEAFIAGLLHDIGVLVLEASFHAEFRRIWKLVEMGEDQISQEEGAWGTNHARIGQFLLDQWKIPDLISEAVGNHHNIFATGDNTQAHILVQIVDLANQISKFRICNTPPPQTVALENRSIIISNLGLSAASISEIEEEIISVVIKESGYLEIEIGDVEELLREANRILYRQYLIVEDLLRENKMMQRQLAERTVKDSSSEAVRRLAEIFNHYIEGACNMIHKQARILEEGILDGDINDRKGVASLSTSKMLDAVESISALMEEFNQITETGFSADLNENQPPAFSQKLQEQFEVLEEALEPVVK